MSITRAHGEFKSEYVHLSAERIKMLRNLRRAGLYPSGYTNEINVKRKCKVFHVLN